MLAKTRRAWEPDESAATDEATFLSRRRFLQMTGLGAGSLLAASCGHPLDGTKGGDLDALLGTIPSVRPPYPVARSTGFTADRNLTDELVAARFNNFYEFATDKAAVWKLATGFRADPWSVEVTGRVSRPARLDLETLLATMPLEERIYRFRCVEAWAMTVPWTGFPLRRLLERVEPKSNARYVRFTSFSDPAQMPGVKTQSWYEWPYYEALRMDEAMNDLTLVVTGIYGHPLPKQHGAPVRIVVPWKYGFKSPKSVVRIELVEERPATFWNDLVPDEYDFWANVDPSTPHPRWSQATERIIGTGERVPTLPFNGYGEWVGKMYV